MVSQLDLLSASAQPRLPRTFSLPDADVTLHGFLAQPEADRLLARLRESIPWRQDRIRLFGREHDVPRLHQWFADGGMAYTWSGIRMEASPWVPELLEIRVRLRQQTGLRFNTVLANLYRDGSDTVGWHADDEPELGPEPTIASVSLGAERDFALQHKEKADLKEVIALPHGSLLLMKGRTQTCWKHCLPRRRRVREPRINLTFRLVPTEAIEGSAMYSDGA